MTTFNVAPFMPAPLTPLLQTAAERLLAGDLVLLPGDTVWEVACRSDDPVARIRQARLCPDDLTELLYADTQALRGHRPRLHPRLDTLLHVHRRPLGVIDPKHDVDVFSGKPTIVRVAHRPYLRQLLLALGGRPLSVVPARPLGNLPPPLGFGAVRSDLFAGVDHVVLLRQRDYLAQRPHPHVTLDENGELHFLRD
ncbi:MAG: Sua5/YciO/YrdC/YwlC family protein [Saprospiraceae bacterium]